MGLGPRNILSLFYLMIISSLAAIAFVAHFAIAIPTPASRTPQNLTQKMDDLKATDKKWIEIKLKNQRLIAWHGNKPVYAIIISTGKKDTPTPSGIFKIQSKRALDRMRGADYDVPNVPYAMYYDRGYAIHGAYWHNKFGTPISHGCVNVAIDHAKWLFDWANVGIPVVIHP